MSEAQNIMETINTKGANPKIVKKLMMTMQEMGADFTEMTGKPPPGPLMMLGGKKLENVSFRRVIGLIWHIKYISYDPKIGCFFR